VHGVRRMATSAASPGIFRFGAYEFEPRAGELRKQGVRVRLEGQPVAILQMLLERPGELVTREELQRKLWAADTFVDFEHSLNAAVKRLRAALNDSADVPRYIETLVGRGYRFISPVTLASAAAGPVVQDEAGRQPDHQAPSPFSRLRFWIAAGALLAAGLATWGWRASRSRLLDPTTTPAIRSLAVLPLENLSGDPSQEYFADGMTDALITDLAQISSLRVISRTSSMRYKGARKSLPDIARELSVDAIVEGTVVRSGNHVRVTSQLVYASLDRHLWARSYERDLSDVVGLQGDVAREISQAIRIKLTPQEQSRLTNPRPANRDAYEAFLKGRYFLDKRTEKTTEKAIEYFEQAIEKDPNYAEAHAALADCYINLALSEVSPQVMPPDVAFPKARAAVNRALEIDDTLAEAHASLGHIMFLYDREWPGAEKEFQRALELNPNYSWTYLLYAFHRMWTGRTDEALKTVKRARDLDPLSLSINANLALILFGAHQYDQAIEQCRKTLEMDPNFAMARYRLGMIQNLEGHYREAVPELEETVAVTGSPKAIAELGLAYSRLGKRDAARKLLNDLKEKSRRYYVSPFNLAIIYGGLGDKDRALDMLEQAYKDHSPLLHHLKLSPAFADLRSEPRYANLVRRLGLPP
jgi:TolB-like protein/DNA-binding winged helix-turn-helix (wHTH) protein/Tfp pilus assembly protein PilF